MKLKPLWGKRSRTASSSGTSNPHQASSSSSSSANVVANNDDLLIEILLRLPIRPLLKFKCISKHWLSLISNPHFSARRGCPTPNPVSGLFLRTSSFIPNIKFDFLSLDDIDIDIDVKPAPRGPFFTSLTFGNNHDHHSGTTILQSCNGLLLCCSFDEYHCENDYYVYNPTTMHFTTLPKLPLSDHVEFRSFFCLALAFDPSRSPHYKVICVQRYNSSMNQYRIQIYSSDTGPWRLSMSSFFSAPCDVYFHDGVYWNGAIHWIVPSLCFHIDQEQVKKMPSPPRLSIIDDNEETRRVRYFGESCDHLHLIESYGPLHQQLHIYEMETDYSRWYVKYYVDLDPFIAELPEMMLKNYLDPFHFHYHVLDVLCFVYRKNDLHGHDSSFLVLHVPGQATRYNLHCKSFKTIRNFSPHEVSDLGHYLRFTWRDAFQFIESITCV